MSSNGIEIANVHVNQERHVAQPVPARLYNGAYTIEEQQDWVREQKEMARNVIHYTAKAQLRNASTAFHNASLHIYNVENGVLKGDRRIDFGRIPPGAVSEQAFPLGTTSNWYIGEVIVDNQSYPANYSLNVPAPTRGGGKGFWARLFSAPEMH